MLSFTLLGGAEHLPLMRSSKWKRGSGLPAHTAFALLHKLPSSQPMLSSPTSTYSLPHPTCGRVSEQPCAAELPGRLHYSGPHYDEQLQKPVQTQLQTVQPTHPPQLDS